MIEVLSLSAEKITTGEDKSSVNSFPSQNMLLFAFSLSSLLVLAYALPFILIMEGGTEMKRDFLEKCDLAVLLEMAPEQVRADGCLNRKITVS